MKVEFSKHAQNKIAERELEVSEVIKVLKSPGREIKRKEGIRWVRIK